MCLKKHHVGCMTCDCDDNCDCYNCFLDKKERANKRPPKKRCLFWKIEFSSPRPRANKTGTKKFIYTNI